MACKNVLFLKYLTIIDFKLKQDQVNDLLNVYL